MEQTVRFYFSFRSPYAWFAAERWRAELGDVPHTVERVPFYPTPETFPNDPTLHPAKYRYVVQDLMRLAEEYSLPLRPPCSLDTDWARAHAAYLGVEREQPERAESFLLEMYRCRFTKSLDVALDEVIAGAAECASVEPRLAVQAAASPALQAAVSANFTMGRERDGIFGAPSFVLGKQLFWGHDRMRHLRSALVTAQRKPAAVSG